MFKQINSMPAKVCLGICALVSLIYSLNFMLFADCYVIGGDGCFTVLSNDAAEGTQAWGRGAPETAFNGHFFDAGYVSCSDVVIERRR